MPGYGTAEDVYGAIPINMQGGMATHTSGPAAVPKSAPVVAQAPGSMAVLASPTFWLVALIGLAMGLIGFSFRAGRR